MPISYKVWAPQKGDRTDWVYFIRSPRFSAGEIKIGYSGKLRERLYQLTSDFGEIEVLAIVRGDKLEEELFHSAFSQVRLHGEWFAPTATLLSVIDYCARTQKCPPCVQNAAQLKRAAREAEALARSAAQSIRSLLSADMREEII